jgi:large subunit ribosomal protein L18
MLRRRREGKTDYKMRMTILKKGVPRLVVRKSLNYIITQLVEYHPSGDKTKISAISKELKNLGWKYHCGNLPASYLTGFLLGTRACKAGIKKAVLDLGLQTSIRGCALYAAVKGALDAGMQIPCSADVLPPEDRISGKHIEKYAQELEKKLFKRQFSGYLKGGADPKKISSETNLIKEKILKSARKVGKK